MNPRQARASWIVAGCLALCVWLLMQDPALAQAAGAGAGDAGSFQCTANGRGSGQLFVSNAACPTQISTDHLFSFLVCNMEKLSSNLLGNMFCGVVTKLSPVVTAALTLATALFGIGFTIGVVPATAREFGVYLLKFACVTAFATEADLLVNVGYRFFISGIRDGISLALANFPGASNSAADVYAQLDGVVKQVIDYATANVISPPKTGDAAAQAAFSATFCKNAIFSALAIMGVAFPAIFFMGLLLMTKIALTFLRAVFGYVYALVGIAFLMVLAPFFITFSLFRQTRAFFDKWLGYMASFALQIIILFAFLSFILSLNVSGVAGSLPSIVIADTSVHETTAFRMPWEYCTLCEFDVVDGTTGAPISASANNGGADANSVALNKKLQCRKDANGNPIPISATTAIDADTNSNSGSPGSPNKKILNDLMGFTITGLMSLVVLAYVVEALLSNVAQLAQVLAGGIGGATFAPQLGDSYNRFARPTVSLPGEGLLDDFGVGFQTAYQQRGDSATATLSGLRGGMESALTGRIYQGKDENGQDQYASLSDPLNGQSRGIKDRFADWLVDPNHLDN